MAHHDEDEERAAALENLDEALSTAVEQLALYLDLNYEPDDRSAPDDLLAAVLHRYAKHQHPQSDLPLATLPEIIGEVLEAREDSDWRRQKYREEYGEEAGDLLASMDDAGGEVALRFSDCADVGIALNRYSSRVDRYLGESSGLPAAQKAQKNADRNEAVAFEVYYSYWKNPEKFKLERGTKDPHKESVFEYVGQKFHLSAASIEGIYLARYSREEREGLKQRARQRRKKRGCSESP